MAQADVLTPAGEVRTLKGRETGRVAGGQHRRDRLETGGGNRTLWGALTARTAVFRIAAGRHAFEARTLLGERFAGIVCSDRWRGDDYLNPSQRQLCWAHLLRDFTAHSEGMVEQKTFGEQGLRIARDLFAAWDDYQTTRRSRATTSTDGATASNASRAARTRSPQEHKDEVPPAVRQEPAQALARALDLHRHRRRRADQQSRRTRPARRRHLPQALTRQPIRTRRTHDRAAPLRLDHLPPPAPLALRLPHRRPQRQHPRRPHPPRSPERRTPER